MPADNKQYETECTTAFETNQTYTNSNQTTNIYQQHSIFDTRKSPTQPSIQLNILRL